MIEDFLKDIKRGQIYTFIYEKEKKLFWEKSIYYVINGVKKVINFLNFQGYIVM